MAKSRNRVRVAWCVALALIGVSACVVMRSQRQPVGAARSTTARATTAPVTTQAGAKLTITIKDRRSKKGDLIFGVFTQPDGFPNVESKSVYWEVKAADAETVTFTTHLPPGRYAAGVLHDENSSGDMDKGLAGIPLEGYGVTNNPKPSLRKATFDEATFTLPPEGAEMTISLQYF